MASYKELLAERERLTAEIDKLFKEERSGVIGEIRQKMLDYGIGLDELGGRKRGKTPKDGRAAVAAKYRDPNTGVEWSGRGKPPGWIKDAPDRNAFLIQ